MLPKNLLVVDDSPTARMLISLTLKKGLGYKIQEAADGTEAVAKLESGQVDLVLTDVKMPKMNGFELISYIRGQHSRPEIPIIVITTKGEEADRDHGLALGANGYIPKPISGTEVLTQVRNLLKD
jgi:two-component system chemotaxis response regulator CheY